jgi:hypothetical protein
VPLIGLSQKAKDLGYVQNWAGDYNTYWYVLGWSVDGHVALLEIHTDDMWGGCSYEIVIQNMKTDEIVENINLYSGGLSEPDYNEEGQVVGEDYNCDSSYVMKTYYHTYKKLFLKYKIIENDFNKFNSSGIIDFNKFNSSSIIDNKYTIIFKSTDTHIPKGLEEGDDYKGCELYWCGNRPVDYVLTVKDRNNKTKILTKGTDWCASHINYVGYFKSPYEDRLLMVIYSKESDASQTYYSKYKFIGCSLNPSTFK